MKTHLKIGKIGKTTALAACAAASLALHGCGGASSGGNGGGSGGDTGLIAFASDRDGNSEIYVMAPDGTNPTRLTDNAATDTRPALSFDRTRLVFESARGIAEPASLGKPRNAKVGAKASIRPRHTPAGANIWRLDANAANSEVTSTQLTTSGEDFSPVWSRNGARIAFRSERDGNDEIYVMNADGTNQTRLTTNEASDLDPDFSPDGTKIVFASNRNNIAAIYDIWVMNSDGSGVPVRLTSDAGANLGPVFSPDGTRIAFWSTRTGNSDIWIMDAANGANLQRLTGNADNDRYPAWSPDGRKIVFYSNRGAADEIWKIDIASGTETRLTNNANEEDFPDWR